MPKINRKRPSDLIMQKFSQIDQETEADRKEKKYSNDFSET